MTNRLSPKNTSRATVTKRELRSMQRRLAASESEELRGVANALDKALAGEAITTAHIPTCTCHGAPCWTRNDACPHGSKGACWLGCAGCEHQPLECSICLPNARVAWALGVAFPNAKLGIELGLPKHGGADWAEEFFRRGADGVLMQPAEVGMLVQDVGYHEAIAQLDRDHAENEMIIRQIRAAACTRSEQLKAFRKGKGVDPSWLL